MIRNLEILKERRAQDLEVHNSISNSRSAYRTQKRELLVQAISSSCGALTLDLANQNSADALTIQLIDESEVDLPFGLNIYALSEGDLERFLVLITAHGVAKDYGYLLVQWNVSEHGEKISALANAVIDRRQADLIPNASQFPLTVESVTLARGLQQMLETFTSGFLRALGQEKAKASVGQ